MSLNGVMTVTLRYFTEFGKPAFPHITASVCGGIYERVCCSTDTTYICIYCTYIQYIVYIYCNRRYEPYLQRRAIPERLRGVITTRRYTNPRLPLPLRVRRHRKESSHSLSHPLMSFLLLYAARNSVVVNLDLNETSVLIEWRPGLKEFQIKGTETEKAVASLRFVSPGAVTHDVTLLLKK